MNQTSIQQTQKTMFPQRIIMRCCLSCISVLVLLFSLSGCISKNENQKERKIINEAAFVPIDITGDFEINASRAEYYIGIDQDRILESIYSLLVYKNDTLFHQFSDPADKRESKTYYIIDSVSYLDYGKAFWCLKKFVVDFPYGSNFDTELEKKLKKSEVGPREVSRDKHLDLIIVLNGGSGWIETDHSFHFEKLYIGLLGRTEYIVNRAEFRERSPMIPMEFPI